IFSVVFAGMFFSIGADYGTFAAAFLSAFLAAQAYFVLIHTEKSSFENGVLHTEAYVSLSDRLSTYGKLFAAGARFHWRWFAVVSVSIAILVSGFMALPPPVVGILAVAFLVLLLPTLQDALRRHYAFNADARLNGGLAAMAVRRKQQPN